MNKDNTFTVVIDGLRRPTSLEFIGNSAFVVTLGIENIKASRVRPMASALSNRVLTTDHFEDVCRAINIGLLARPPSVLSEAHPRCRRPQAGLEDEEKLLTKIIDRSGMARRGSRRGLLGQDRVGELIGHRIHEHLVVALTVGYDGSPPPADLPESCLAVGPDGGEVP